MAVVTCPAAKAMDGVDQKPGYYDENQTCNGKGKKSDTVFGGGLRRQRPEDVRDSSLPQTCLKQREK